MSAELSLPILELEGSEVAPDSVEQSEAGRLVRFPHGIVAESEVTQLGAFRYERWTLRSEADHDTPAITGFWPLALSRDVSGRHVPTLHGVSGGLDDRVYPPKAWTEFAKSIPSEGLSHPLVIESQGGRSSDAVLPLFVLEDSDRRGGVLLAVGWSGDWRLEYRRNNWSDAPFSDTVTVRAGMKNLNLVLYPGERFIQPSILSAAYTGDAERGKSVLRDFLRDSWQPNLGTGRFAPTVFWDSYYGDRGNLTEADVLAELPLAAEIGVEYFVIDGGWNGGGEDQRWESLPPFIGSWTPHPSKFPRGFGEITRRANELGVGLGVWTDAERAHAASPAATNHPELFFPTPVTNGCLLLRLDLAEARAWLSETLSSVIEGLGATWIRFDFNSAPAETWAANELETRRGSLESRYVENLYGVLDDLRERFPQLVIENCASGGLRIDLEMLRRTHTNWISDYSQGESIIRYHLFGAAGWLSTSRLGTAMAHALLEQHRPVDWTAPLPASAYLSHFGGNFGLSDRLVPMTAEGRSALADYVRAFTLTKACFDGAIERIGRQADVLDGPVGFAATSDAGDRALLLFGVSADEADAHCPRSHADLLVNAPLVGDEGTDQFTSAYLWYAPRAATDRK